MTYYLYTDGGCRGNPGIGGWGYHLITPEHKIIEKYGNERMTTNNRMELTAVIEGLLAIPKSENVIVYTDSTYVKNGIQSWISNWKRNGWMTAKQIPVGGGRSGVGVCKARLALARLGPARVSSAWLSSRRLSSRSASSAYGASSILTRSR